MKSHRSTTILALPLLALSLSGTVRAASVVNCDRWIDRLPQPKTLDGGAVKGSAPKDWVRFEAPVVARRGTRTLSSGTLQFIKGSALDLATHRRGQSLLKTLTIADVEIAGSVMSNIEPASVEDANAGAFTLANTSEILQAAAIANQLPFEPSDVADLAMSDNFESAIAPNSISSASSDASETSIATQGSVPVPEPSAVALSALTVIGLLARRRRR
jgi:hypothetical protein